MLKMKRMRVVAAAASWLFLGCGAGAPSREDQAAKLQAKLFFVQTVACLSPATQKECDPGLAAEFSENSSSIPITDNPTVARRGSIWCEGGRPHLRVSAPSGEVTGEFGQVVWESIWRVLKAADLYASAYGRAVSVTRNGQMRACKDPRFDMHELFDMAAVQARTGPPAVVRKISSPDDGTQNSRGTLCQIDTDACRTNTRSPLCPPFLGDPWNGVTAKRDEGANSGPDEGPNNANDLSETEEPGPRPTQSEITKALAAVLARARNCLGAGAPTSRANIVFQSDGTVQHVEVRDSGKPAAACIEKALRRARVSSFSDPSFKVTITVRSSR